MIIQLRGVTDEFVEDLKRLTRESTASKAFIFAAENYEALLSQVLQQEIELVYREKRIERLIAIIEGARTAAALLLDRTGQIDLDLPEGH